jgi:hypothetical protein
MFVFKMSRQPQHVREGHRKSFHGVYQIVSSAECMCSVCPSGAIVTACYLSGYCILAVFDGDLPGNVLAVRMTRAESLLLHLTDDKMCMLLGGHNIPQPNSYSHQIFDWAHTQHKCGDKCQTVYVLVPTQLILSGSMSSTESPASTMSQGIGNMSTSHIAIRGALKPEYSSPLVPSREFCNEMICAWQECMSPLSQAQSPCTICGQCFKGDHGCESC